MSFWHRWDVCSCRSYNGKYITINTYFQEQIRMNFFRRTFKIVSSGCSLKFVFWECRENVLKTVLLESISCKIASCFHIVKNRPQMFLVGIFRNSRYIYLIEHFEHHGSPYRNSLSKIGVLANFENFIGKHLSFLNKVPDM